MDTLAMNEMDKKRQQEDEEVLNHPVNIDGHKLTLRDVFPDAYAARDFRTKLKLLNSRASGEPDSGPAPKVEELQDSLFGPKRKQEKNPVGMDGE